MLCATLTNIEMQRTPKSSSTPSSGRRRANWVIMEICGGQTHTLIKSGIDRMLPPQVTLVHGPGCPVCVTPLELIDRAIAIAAGPR